MLLIELLSYIAANPSILALETGKNTPLAVIAKVKRLLCLGKNFVVLCFCLFSLTSLTTSCPWEHARLLKTDSPQNSSQINKPLNHLLKCFPLQDSIALGVIQGKVCWTQTQNKHFLFLQKVYICIWTPLTFQTDKILITGIK